MSWHGLQAVFESYYPGKIESIMDEKEVDVASLEPGKAYIQVTFVEPYFPEHELKRRVTEYERSINLTQFK